MTEQEKAQICWSARMLADARKPLLLAKFGAPDPWATRPWWRKAIDWITRKKPPRVLPDFPAGVTMRWKRMEQEAKP